MVFHLREWFYDVTSFRMECFLVLIWYRWQYITASLFYKMTLHWLKFIYWRRTSTGTISVTTRAIVLGIFAFLSKPKLFHRIMTIIVRRIIGRQCTSSINSICSQRRLFLWHFIIRTTLWIITATVLQVLRSFFIFHGGEEFLYLTFYHIVIGVFVNAVGLWWIRQLSTKAFVL